MNSKGKVPQAKQVNHFLDDLTGYLFPVLSIGQEKEADEIISSMKIILKSFHTDLSDIDLTAKLFERSLPQLYKSLTKDALAIYEGDPAATSVEEVIICYPGFYAILVYRIANKLHKLSIPIIPRMLTEYSHSKTGIDIHPKAMIGESFCIDHGTGIVIGETTEVGNHVKIYQGVTLGAHSVSKESAGVKRHPTIQDYTVIYAGSTILGGDTIIGHHSTIGGNVWLTHSVDPFSVVLNEATVSLKNNQPNKKK